MTAPTPAPRSGRAVPTLSRVSPGHAGWAPPDELTDPDPVPQDRLPGPGRIDSAGREALPAA
ncbi:hypothetical protein ACWKSP_02110 [Micromonosporaceae bacterium Da 78-11]